MPRRRAAKIVDARQEEDESSSSSSSDEDLMDDGGPTGVEEEAAEELSDVDGQSGEASEDEEEQEAGVNKAGQGNRSSSGTLNSPCSAGGKSRGAGTSAGAATGGALNGGPRKPLSISLSKMKNEVCKVCGKKGHRAGFVGSVYLDCPNKPCYLCKRLGHTTATCPYRLAPGHGCKIERKKGAKENVLEMLMERESSGSRLKRYRSKGQKWRVEAAILKVHRRRCCCLEFPPQKDGLVLSGDKQGSIAVRNFNKVHDRTVYKFHSCLCNNIRFLPWHDSMSCASASSDGTVKLFDIETGTFRTLLDLNPGGWSQGAPWHMVYGCDSSASLSSIIAGDSRGQVHVLDPRTDSPIASLQLHWPGTKVVSIQLHPVLPACILTAGNDHYARLFDVRKLVSGVGGSNGKAPAAVMPKKGARKEDHPSQLAAMAHPRVVNAANFSPVTGQKILTTCQDNRIRVWDSMLTADMPADREIVHSHDFNRYLTPFKAEWDPKDLCESRFVCGRYISEDFGGVALHPVDVIDASTGELLHQLIDTNLTTISPVNKPHPREDVIISGSSRSLYMWVPTNDDEDDYGASSSQASHGGRRSSYGAVGSSDADAAFARQLQRNEHFVFFDADPGPEKKEKKQKLVGKAVQDWDDDED